jgi:hypothetical protein
MPRVIFIQLITEALMPVHFKIQGVSLAFHIRLPSDLNCGKARSLEIVLQ